MTSIKKTKYPKRHVLGEGYPWAFDVKDHVKIGLCIHPIGVELVRLDLPKIFWRKDVPKYRLVLEMVKEEGDPK